MAWFVFGPAPADEVRAVGTAAHNARTAVSPPATAGQPRTSSDAVVFGLDDEDFGNVLLFVPLPVFAAILWPRRWWLAVPGGVALSGSIELVQLVWLHHRTPEWSDVRWNSVGVLVGAGLVGASMLVVRVLRR